MRNVVSGLLLPIQDWEISAMKSADNVWSDM